MKKKRTRKIFSSSTDSEIDSLFETKKRSAKSIKAAGAFCSLLDGFCPDNSCESCSLLKSEIPHSTWHCSICSEGCIQHPFWADIECQECGWEAGVMVLCTKAKKRAIR